MSNAVIINNNKAFPLGILISLGIFLLLGGVNFFYYKWDIIYSFLSIIISSFLYFIYYLIDSGEFKNILASIFFSALIMALTVIPIIGVIILILFVIYNISKALEGIKNLFPEACFSLVFYALLASKQMLKLDFSQSIISFLIYVIAAIIYHVRLSKLNLNTKTIYFRISIMFISIPLISILVISIISSLRNIFSANNYTRSSIIKTPQQVSGYTNSYGTDVASYTRNISSTVTENITQITAGSGALTSSMIKSISEGLNSKNHDLNNDYTLQKSVSFTELKTIENTSKRINEKLLKLGIPETNDNEKFYRFDNLNNKKINNFIKDIRKIDNLPMISKSDVLAYFDETIFGKGDKGVIITKDIFIANIGLGYPTFFVYLQDIYNLTEKSRLNTKINFNCNNKEYELVITQSNKGAKKVFDTINYLKSIR